MASNLDDRNEYAHEFTIRYTVTGKVDLESISERLNTLMSKFDDFVTASTSANTALASALDNVIADQANLLQQIVDLKNQIGTGTLSPAQEQQLDSIIASQTAVVNKATALAAQVPDLPPPPPPPGS